MSESVEEEAVNGDSMNILDRARHERQIHVPALIIAALIGVVFSWFHWIGLIIGGALVGLVSSSLSRAIIGGLVFGVIILVVLAVSLGGDAARLPEMTPIIYITLGSGLILPVIGSLIRGIIP